MSGYDSAIKTQTLLHVSIFIETVCSFFPAYYNWIYMLTPNYWRFRRACQTVHKFSLEVIRKRRADLEEQKVGHTHSEIRVRFYWSSLFFACQRKGEDVLNGRKKKYFDFIDMLLEAKVRILDIFCI